MAKGHIDILTHQAVTGWVAAATDTDDPCRYAKIFLDGVEIGTVRADLFRKDIRDAGISDGHSGVWFAFPTIPNPFADHVVEVRDRDSNLAIPPYPMTLHSVVGRKAQSYLRIDPRFATTHIRTARFDDGLWQVEAELFGPKRLALEPSIRGGTIEDFRQQSLPDHFLGGLGIERKIAVFRLRGNQDADVMHLELLQDGARAIRCEAVCHIALPRVLPGYVDGIGVENMVRVSGPGVTPSLFAASGVNTAFRVDALLKRHFEKGLVGFERILDWGVGSGRVALPVKKFIAPASTIVGSDVDNVNVELGRSQFGDIEFVQSPFYPPLPCESDSFDAAYGISVVTHLTEGAQFAWLKELRRVLKRGAPVVLTVHGEYALLDVATREPDVMRAALRRGFSDQLMDMNLGPQLSDRSYYRATFHTRKYIADHWTEHFDIIAHYTCANVVIQDFVVLRAK